MPVDVALLALFSAGAVYLVMHRLASKRERALAQAKAAAARFRSLTELSADWFWETDAEHRITWISGGTPVATFFGHSPAYGKRFWEIARVEVEPRALQAHLERLEEKLSFFDLEIARRDERGARQIHIISGQSHVAADGRFLGYRGVGRDITEQRRAEEKLFGAKERLELALDGGNLAEWHFDVAADELYAGDGWVRFLGHDRSPPVTRGADLFALIDAEDRPKVKAMLVRALKGEVAQFDVEFRIATKDGQWKWLHAKGRVVERGAGERAQRMSGTVADIDERKRAQSSLQETEQRYRALIELAPDGIVVSSGGVVEYANAAAVRMLRAGSPRRLLGMSVEDFFHPGPGVTTFEDRRVRALDGADITVQVASVSFLERGRLLLQTVFRDVTEASGEADVTARKTAAARVEQLATRENELRSALARSELTLHWQPVIRGRNQLVGAEALVRWQHPGRGLLQPEDFVPLAEECGLIRAVGEWTLERALSQAGAWQRKFPGRAWIALNVSAPELALGQGYVERVRDALQANGLDGASLELEVTERVLMSSLEEHIEVLRRIGELGVRFAIDDFGTGYSSLAYLRALPIDKLKIDRAFLRTIDTDAADEAIARTIAALAKTLGLSVAAEGVETEAQLARLLALGCDEWQGHYFSAPLDATAFEAMLSSSALSERISRKSEA